MRPRQALVKNFTLDDPLLDRLLDELVRRDNELEQKAAESKAATDELEERTTYRVVVNGLPVVVNGLQVVIR